MLLPLMHRASSLDLQSYSEADNAVDVVWTTGETARNRLPSIGVVDEELIVSPNAVRLGRLNAGAPLLNAHDKKGLGLSSIIGAVIPGSARLERGKGLARVQLSRAPEDAGTVQKIRDGIIRNVSTGYQIHAMERVMRVGEDVPLFRVLDWEPFELSALGVAADSGAQFRDAADTFPVRIIGDDRRVIRMRMAQRHASI